ncbi:hypothetical protein [Palleronia caenipelagi]|uniref:Uncharacterized protein n=1 Tax=Palleronia caenipelagi TaxID=2489174 RepID=A0A547Q8B2_9RHOB|nr:hypothetical protein [Palleronia caenipelagi]TRD22603.1 hypothetical protein FEV53_04090 [Palleronia caenipelagi]
MLSVVNFAILTRLIIAACKAASDPGAAASPEALCNVIVDRDTPRSRMKGAEPLVWSLTAAAEDADRALGHASQWRDDAKALFWQLAPQVLSRPDLLTGSQLDPAKTCDAMIA